MDTPVFHDFRSFLAELESIDMHQTEASPCPILLDVFSGVHAPLSKAFLWCQWEIITPIDIEIDQDLDVSRPAGPVGLFRLCFLGWPLLRGL